MAARFFTTAYLAVNRVCPRLAPAIRHWLLCSVKKWVRGSNNRLDYGSSILERVTFDIVGSDNVVEIQNAYVNGVTFRIRGNHHKIVIGPGCRFNHGGVIWFEDHRGRITIAAGSTFENVHLAVSEETSLSIGSDCMFAYDIDVRTTDSHSILDASSRQRVNAAASIEIGNHVWIAAHCTVLKGVSIADNSIVAARSVVTKSSPQAGVILAGSPARVVKEGITWQREKISSEMPAQP